jgi:dinuclear metal center YbgI/SA1388 family protein
MKAIVKKKESSIDVKRKRKEDVYIGGLEFLLLNKYPRITAVPGDKMGLLAGDPTKKISKVAVALDPTIEAINSAKKAGANVLLTHHPAFRGEVDGFFPPIFGSVYPGNVVYEAISKDVALINVHTALDVSEDAQRVLPSLLHLKPLKGKSKIGGKKVKNKILLPIGGSKNLGFGQLCSVEEELTLGDLAGRCISVFGKKPRVWGDSSRIIKRCVTATGSAGNLIEESILKRVDVLIAGEFKYHDALQATQGGLCLIELGHDVSEIPLIAVLANACKSCGLDSSQIVILDQSHNWWEPQATRI